MSPAEEIAVIAQYKSERTQESLEADYRDVDKLIGEGVAAEDLLKELQDDSPTE